MSEPEEEEARWTLLSWLPPGVGAEFGIEEAEVQAEVDAVVDVDADAAGAAASAAAAAASSDVLTSSCFAKTSERRYDVLAPFAYAVWTQPKRR